MATKSTKTGTDMERRGRDAAARHLTNQGYEILERDYACEAGRADIVARTGRVLVFVDVVTTAAGEPVDTCYTDERRDAFERVAVAYATERGVTDLKCRGDVIAVNVISPGQALLKHHVAASATSREDSLEERIARAAALLDTRAEALCAGDSERAEELLLEARRALAPEPRG